jgi:hypothetical protein
MNIQEFQLLKQQDLEKLIPCRKIAYEKGDALKIVENGRHIDLLSHYKNQWHYITTYKKED